MKSGQNPIDIEKLSKICESITKINIVMKPSIWLFMLLQISVIAVFVHCWQQRDRQFY